MERKTPTVLIVDDEEDVRILLRVYFDLRDFLIVGEAADGYEAVKMAIETEPDFVILDYKMPGMNGEEAAKEIRQILPRVWIIAFSAVLDSKPEWADAFLDKTQIGEIAPLLESFFDLNH